MDDTQADNKKDDDSKKIVHNYPLVRYCEMSEEMKTEIVELCVTAIEKYATSHEGCARMMKETLDRKLGGSWHAVVGGGFGFDVSHEAPNLLYLYTAASLAVLVWKCS